MKKIFFISFSLIVLMSPLNAYCTKWQSFYTDQYQTAFLDTANIQKRGGDYIVWVKYIPKPSLSYKKVVYGRKVTIQKTFMYLSCRPRWVQTYMEQFYDEDGLIGQYDSSNTDPNPVEQGAAKALYDKLCPSKK